jgi:hypothetical protein
LTPAPSTAKKATIDNLSIFTADLYDQSTKVDPNEIALIRFFFRIGPLSYRHGEYLSGIKYFMEDMVHEGYFPGKNMLAFSASYLRHILILFKSGFKLCYFRTSTRTLIHIP